ncbi:MAG: hypothetical protein KDD66_14170 [Bdellovibrionales bacterium]|nr:hypothetical protein [Bdellovibrionales bacterium]
MENTAPTKLTHRRWIVSAKYDFVFFIGSAGASLLLYLFHLLLVSTFNLRLEERTGLISFVLFIGLFDMPHILQTFSRTHADRQEYERHRNRITWGLVAALIIGEVLLAAELEDYLFMVGALYGIWHILRQNVGFVKIYKALHKDFARIDNLLDSGIFYATVLACVTELEELIGAAVVVAVLFVVRQIQLAVKTGSVNLPKLLFIGVQIPLYWYLFFGLDVPILLFVAIETIYHDIQYYGWIRFYQKQRFREDPGFANRWLIRTVAASLIISGVTYSAFVSSGATYFSELNRDVLTYFFVPLYMLVLYHYYIEGFIWRFRESPELKEVLYSSVEPVT